MFLDQDHSYDCFDRNNSHWEPSYIDIQSNSFLLGMQRFLLVCKSRQGQVPFFSFSQILLHTARLRDRLQQRPMGWAGKRQPSLSWFLSLYGKCRRAPDLHEDHPQVLLLQTPCSFETGMETSLWRIAILVSSPFCCWNLASVQRCQIEMWRQSFGWRRKKQHYCFAIPKNPQQANALKTLTPLGEIGWWFYSLGVKNRATGKD